LVPHLESNVVIRFANGASLGLGAGFRRCSDIMPGISSEIFGPYFWFKFIE
jgi:hypothetical protein